MNGNGWGKNLIKQLNRATFVSADVDRTRWRQRWFPRSNPILVILAARSLNFFCMCVCGAGEFVSFFWHGSNIQLSATTTTAAVTTTKRKNSLPIFSETARNRILVSETENAPVLLLLNQIFNYR